MTEVLSLGHRRPANWKRKRTRGKRKRENVEEVEEATEKELFWAIGKRELSEVKSIVRKRPELLR